MWWTAFKYLLVGAFFWGIGAFVLGSDMAFYARSEPAQLIVLRLDSKREADHHDRYRSHTQKLYRPVFALDIPTRPRPEYAGNTWTSPPAHKVGDRVAGRYDPDSGEMQSNKLLQATFWLSVLIQIIGLFSILQGILMFFGVPESMLPLRVHSGT